jgi:hypothetical protein
VQQDQTYNAIDSKNPLDHISSGELELYALCRLGPAKDAEIEEHILTCERCRARMTGGESGIEQIPAIRTCVAKHATTEGVVEFWTERLGTCWIGRIEHGDVRWFTTGTRLEEVIRDVSDRFSQMFPEHACTDACVRDNAIW